MTPQCPWCTGDCAGVNDAPLRGENLDWLWQRLADVGDRRGDQDLITGTAAVTAPADAMQRAAVTGLVGGRTPRAGQTIRVDLSALTARLQAHDPRLKPGMLAAHTAGRSLGERIRGNAERRDALEHLRRHALNAIDCEGEFWPALHRAGWVARLLATSNREQIVDQAAAVIAALPAPGERLDRRRLADTVTGFPHALDSGTLPGLVLAILTATGRVPTGLPPRAAWAAAGVDCDDLTGGLLALGIHPAGWSLPTGTVVTLPPRELARCTWPEPPQPGARVFVTENPSVVTAAADLGNDAPVRLLCTVGTPSALEVDAIGRLAGAGWQVAVRADFDQAGLQHVATLLAGIPSAVPWRMTAADYLSSLTSPAHGRTQLDTAALPTTAWDPNLHEAMTESGCAAYEESLIDELLDDLLKH
ncbi:DUF2399 domain-containing protein [Micromonospora sp. WMMD1120]|uniref:DUF2399 domain-containing protein n=1 Tax=Micromonospora sp. WMMD1120 TaxID=3016106 RepID=UPI002417FF2B|nr:DUF2399 domain-containing protein [Micromonospora sp. WMMD1120]MDG4811161.1 DUF2399 domain-containing protein [Micromonospora sp. WMMD1120]